MRNKRKGILMASAILGSAAIVSTGFAAWVITAPTETSQTGNITIDTVSDNRVKMTAEWADGDGTVVFGAPESQAANAWLRNDEKKEDIKHILNLSFAWADSTKTDSLSSVDGKVTAKVEIGTGTGTDFVADATQTSEYIVLPTISDKEIEDGGAVTLNVDFGWGEKFSNSNPYSYYTAHGANDYVEGNSGDTWADKAVKELKAMETALKGKTFKITLSFTFNDVTNS